ncbi:MAG: glycosyltransferase family 2 protein, partial [Syntrophorhabdaceae bacterium]|nr:glycosyltransferase family 2 protein [Syntrophorhabdaceae bacterium]
MIVKNEEENLPRVLGSIQGLADEIIVVDTGSTDRTVEVAKSFGAKVYFFEWCDDFSAARNESLRHATCDYILWLDGDDEVPKSEHIKIKKDLSEKKYGAFYLHIKNNLQNDENISIQLRIFPNRRDIKFSGRIHEQIYDALRAMNVPMFLSDATIIHHGYYDNLDTIKKLKRNKNILLKELEEHPANIIYTLFFLTRTLRGLNELNEASIYIDKIIEKGRIDREFAKSDIMKISLTEKAAILCSQGRIEDAISLF